MLRCDSQERRAEMKKKRDRETTQRMQERPWQLAGCEGELLFHRAKGRKKGRVHLKFPSQRRHLQKKLNLSSFLAQRGDAESRRGGRSCCKVRATLHPPVAAALYLVLTSHLHSIHHPFISCQHLCCIHVNNNSKNNTFFSVPMTLVPNESMLLLSLQTNADYSHHVEKKINI